MLLAVLIQISDDFAILVQSLDNKLQSSICLFRCDSALYSLGDIKIANFCVDILQFTIALSILANCNCIG